MANRYNQNMGNTNVHFSKAMFNEVERSRMTANPLHLTSFNAGDIVPIYCREVLPQEDMSVDLDFVIRQTTLLAPTMGSMKVDFYAFFVPNRVVNQSWKAVEGENYTGSWTANNVTLAPLAANSTPDNVQVPVGSVADYYGFPTQRPIPYSVLRQCNDLKFRGYVMIYNEFFRDQNYQPPIPMSTLNVYQGFFDPDNSSIGIIGDGEFSGSAPLAPSDGSYGAGAVFNAIYGSGTGEAGDFMAQARSPLNAFRALHKPLKANKLHDYFTSVLPSPQKSKSGVFVPVSGSIGGGVPVVTSDNVVSGSYPALKMLQTDGNPMNMSNYSRMYVGNDSQGNGVAHENQGYSLSDPHTLFPANLVLSDAANIDGLEVSLDDVRMASAIQQVYETLARGGSRYRELVQSFFGISVDDPYSDIPTCLGHISRDLDLYQTAQTSPSESGSTPQGNLAAFGYTASGGHLFNSKFIEHGYVHIFAIVRHRNVYPSYLSRDNFRMSMLDFYMPPLANISEQPVFAREVNPFAPNPNDAFGYQEAWAEYRFEPDIVSGYMRPGIDNSLALWNYADDFNSALQISDGTWLKSNSEEVLNRTLAVTSAVAPQLKGAFRFIVDKTLPMPTYSVPGMDII